MAFPRRRSLFLRYLLPALLLAVTFCILTETSGLPSQIGPLLLAVIKWGPNGRPTRHPIDDLIEKAEKDFERKLSRATSTLEDAAAAYRRRRGRHPPPGFDKWYEFAAVENNAIIVEDFWDQIYHDLEPFWGVDPRQIRRDAREFEMRIEIRDHKASTRSDWFWTQIWLQMIQAIEHLLPDLDLALNAMDEPRLVVPWEEMREYMRRAAKTRTMADPRDVVSTFSKRPPPGEEELDDVGTTEKVWESERHYWLIARRGCAPSSAARKAEVITDFNKTPFIASSFGLKHMRHGYVDNYTLSTDFCHQADLQALEGIFVEPFSVSATASLLPVFGGSKLAVNNDILLPAPMYWNEEERFTGAEGAHIPWSAKYPTAIWRGVATGGLNRESNWRSFQRHRFVAMNNGTQLAQAESGAAAPENFALPAKQYYLAAQQPQPHPQPVTTTPPTTAATPPSDPGALAPWITTTTNITFTDLLCAHPGAWPSCNYTSAYFSPSQPPIPLSAQFQHKLLPDIDGNSFSGRYLGLLRSTSLPVKASLWREWHDARLAAWRHFVPMDSRFGDWFGVVEYFLGNAGRGVRGRDEVGEAVARAGREWAGKVLRREDMLVYVLRLLLEYARVVEEGRERLGWVGDLVEG